MCFKNDYSIKKVSFDIVKFSLHKFHYKVEDKLEKDENDTDSDEESEAIQLNKRGKLSNEMNGLGFRWQ